MTESTELRQGPWPAKEEGVLACPKGEGFTGIKVAGALTGTATFKSAGEGGELVVLCNQGEYRGEFNEDGTSSGNGISELAFGRNAGAEDPGQHHLRLPAAQSQRSGGQREPDPVEPSATNRTTKGPRFGAALFSSPDPSGGRRRSGRFCSAPTRPREQGGASLRRRPSPRR